MVKMLGYLFSVPKLTEMLSFLPSVLLFRVEIRNELANGCKMTNNQIRGWMLSEFRYLVAPPHSSGHTTGQNSQHTISCMDIGVFGWGGLAPTWKRTGMDAWQDRN